MPYKVYCEIQDNYATVDQAEVFLEVLKQKLKKIVRI